ncbi:MAG TPA: hypothetical protein VJA21_29320 [Verrucomicrobiae bacterium]
MSATGNRFRLSLTALRYRGCTSLAAALFATALGLAATSGFAQNTDNASRPLLTLAPAERSPSRGVDSGVTNAARHKLDLNDPRVVAAISEAMDNPISELMAVWNQFDAIQAHFPRTALYEERDLWAYRYQFMPTIPVPLGERWNWVSRIDLSVVSVPLKSEVGRLFQLDPGNNLRPNDTLPAGLDPFGRTTGLGDMVYLGLVGPKHLPKVGTGKLFLAAGPTMIFPSASEGILGQGKWQAGPAVAVGFLTEHWRLGLFPQQWWSFAGDGHRPAVSQMNLQYFLYYAPTPEWEIGMSPNIFVNWNAPSGNQLTFPVGLGVHRLVNIGQLPVSIGIEAGYSVIHPGDLPGSRWGIRFTLMPLLPAPWSHLAKELKALE